MTASPDPARASALPAVPSLSAASKVVLAAAGFPGRAPEDIYVADGRVVGRSPAGEVPSGWEVVDCQGLWVLPGLCDLWAHLPTRQEAWREDPETLSAAARAGGFTTVCTVTGEHRAEALAGRDAPVRLVPVAAGTHAGRLAELDALRRAGAVAFAVDADPGLMRRLLEYAELPLAVHAEEPALARGGVAHESALSALLGLPGIPAEAETVAVARDLLLARAYGGRLHFAHLSTAGATQMVRRAKAAGLPVTAAVPIHNLVLTEDAIRTYDTSARLSPPLRSEDDRQALIQGVIDGTIDAIVSNHRLCPPEDKEGPFAEAAAGAAALHLVLPAAVSVLPAEVAVAALTTRAARCFGLELRGLTLFDPGAEREQAEGALGALRLQGRVLHKHALDSIITTAGGS